MNLQLLEAIALKMVNEVIIAAKTPEVQVIAEDFARKFINMITPVVMEDVKNVKLTAYIPTIFSFCSGFFAGAGVLLLVLAAKAGLL